MASLRMSGLGSLLIPIWIFWDSSGLKKDFLLGPVTLTDPAEASVATAIALLSVYRVSISV